MFFCFGVFERNALSEVTTCLRERLHRWQQIECLCGFPIIRNPGLTNLTAQLYSDSVSVNLARVSQPPCSCHSSLHGSIEDLLEESASPILQKMAGKRFGFCTERPSGVQQFCLVLDQVTKDVIASLTDLDKSSGFI